MEPVLVFAVAFWLGGLWLTAKIAFPSCPTRTFVVAVVLQLLLFYLF